MKIFLTTVLFIGLTLNGMSQNIAINGKITGKAASMVPEVQFFFDGKMKGAKVDKETLTFSTELPLSGPQFVEVKGGGNNSFFLYLVPGEKTVLDIEKPNLNDRSYDLQNDNLKKLNLVMDSFYASITESGYSTQANNWQKEIFGRKEIAVKAIGAARKTMDEQMQFIQKSAPAFPDAFDLFAEAFLNYVTLEDISLTGLESVLKKMADTEMEITVLTIPFFRQYLVELSNVHAARKLESYGIVLDYLKQGHISKLIASETIVKYIPNQSVVNFLLQDKINSELLVNGVKNRQYIDFLMANAGKVVTDKFREKYESLLTNAEAEEEGERIAAVNFEFKDPEGKVYRNEDFRGKMLLIDFWASWCAPCKAQMPHLKELEKQYEGKDIVFAKVSVDASKTAWLKAIESDGHKGVLLHAEGDFRNPFPKAYGINSIPRFMLIDADGKIITDNLPKPQFREEVMAIIDKELFDKELEVILAKHFEAIGAEVLKSGKGLNFKGKQSIPGIEIETEISYLFPENLRYVYAPVGNPTYEMMLGEDFFKSKYMVIRKDTVFGNLGNMTESAKNWENKLVGFELFLAVSIDAADIGYAEENASNAEMYVLQEVKRGVTKKYFIDRKTFLLRKTIISQKADIRSGAGIINAETKYDDFRNVNGVMVPYDVNMNNIITFKLKEANVGSLDPALFQPAEMN